MKWRASRYGMGLAIVAVLTACASPVPMTASSDASDPACAAVIVRLPEDVVGLAIRETTAQATGAWGSPAQVLLRCGVAPPAPSSLPCAEYGGVDWLVDSTAADSYVIATTYGRTPAVEVVLSDSLDQPAAVLADIAGAVDVIAATRRCL